jgi:hypothetical protein
MSMTNYAEQALLDLLFLNLDWVNIGDAGGLQNSANAGSFYISLHSADPGESGDQNTSEVNYTSYDRVAVARSDSGWSRSGSTMSNAVKITFPQCTGGSSTVTHFGIGTAATSTGNLLMKGSLTTPLLVSNGIQPEFVIGSLTAAVD